MTWTNWAGDESCSPATITTPGSVEELCAAVKHAAAAERGIRVVGAGHSFSDLVCTAGTLISLDALTGLLHVDADRGLVQVAAGTRLSALNPLLAEHGLAMPNLGDIDEQSLAGAISTATHGTGATLGNLATQVQALDLVLADGSGRTITAADGDVLRAARVSLGALGAVSAYTLRVVPDFRLRLDVSKASLAETLARLDELVTGNDHFEFFVFPHTDIALIKIGNRTDEPANPPGRLAAFRSEVVENALLDWLCRVGRARPGLIPKLNRAITSTISADTHVDVSHRVFASVRTVRFTETEWAVPRAAAASVVREILQAIDDEGYDVGFPLEVRFVAGDDAFLSPSYERETCYVAAHMYRGMDWRPYFRRVQDIASAYGGRPHWGKRHLLDAAQLAERYPAWDRFQAVRGGLDPDGVFSNAHVRRVLGPTQSAGT